MLRKKQTDINDEILKREEMSIDCLQSYGEGKARRLKLVTNNKAKSG